MGILASGSNLNPGQFSTFDPLERHAPLSRYGTQHPLDKALWKIDRAREAKAKLKSAKVHPHEVLAGVKAAQGGGGHATTSK